MEITQAQYERIASAFPVQRGHVKLSHLQVRNGILHMIEHGCKWRALPARFGPWLTVYTRMNRGAKGGVRDQVFALLQEEQMVRIKREVVALDSTTVKVHPDGTGAPKKRSLGHRAIPRRLDHQEFIGWPRMSGQSLRSPSLRAKPTMRRRDADG